MSELPHDRASALRVLDALTAELELATPARRVFELLADDRECSELGVALPLFDQAGTAVVYYNPRTRGIGARTRMIEAIRAVGLPGEVAAAVLGAVPVERASAVAGIELHADGATSATLYLEEVSRFYAAPERAAAAAAVASAAGLEPLPDDARVGDPYIWAVDLEADGRHAFKLYHLAPSADVGRVRAELHELIGTEPEPWCERALFAPGASAFIIQRRVVGARRRHKVYRCFPYEQGAVSCPPPELAEVLDGLGSGRRERATAALCDRFPMTSLGLAFTPGDARPRAATGYWCLLRGQHRP